MQLKEKADALIQWWPHSRMARTLWWTPEAAAAMMNWILHGRTRPPTEEE